MTITEYLKGCVAYPLGDNAVSTILLRRNISGDADAMMLTLCDRELCTADVYMYCASLPSSMDSSYDADGGWKHQEAGFEITLADKRYLRALARGIYIKWGEAVEVMETSTFIGRKLV